MENTKEIPEIKSARVPFLDWWNRLLEDSKKDSIYKPNQKELNSQKVQDSIDLDSWDDKSDNYTPENIKAFINEDTMTKVDIKPNQKQFKSFDSNLFAAYINKFSDDDKQLAIQVILNSLYENGINLCLRDNDQ